jgi:hypothetical protein
LTCLIISIISNTITMWIRKYRKAPDWVTLIEGLSVFCGLLTLELIVIGRVINGSCKGNMHSFQNRIFCNPEIAQRLIPHDTSILLFLAPTSLYSIFRYNFILAILCWLSVIFTIGLSISLVSATNSLPILILYIPFSLIVLIEGRRRELYQFFLCQRYKQLLDENERSSNEHHATELRQMIGNVAHDLKTVSFIYKYSIS